MKKVTAASFLPQSFLEIEGQAIPLSILGDGAFQIRTWIIEPYGIVWNGHTDYLVSIILFIYDYLNSTTILLCL